jgi:hypothetical protein
MGNERQRNKKENAENSTLRDEAEGCGSEIENVSVVSEPIIQSAVIVVLDLKENRPLVKWGDHDRTLKSEREREKPLKN